MSSEMNKALAEKRRVNLTRLIKGTGQTQYLVAQKIGMSQAGISQYMTGRLHLTRDTCQRIERALGIPDGALDQQTGVEHLLDTVLDGPRDRAPVPRARPTDVKQVVIQTENPLHYAVIDSLTKLLKAGKIGDEECAQMIGRFTLLRTSGGRPRNDDTDALLARLKVNEFELVYQGVGGREEATKRLQVEFDPAVAASVGRHFADLDPLSPTARNEVTKLLGR